MNKEQERHLKEEDFEKNLPQRYILNVMAEQGLGGDAYTTAEELLWACRRNRKMSLSYQAFTADLAVLTREGFVHQEGRRLYLEKIWQYEEAVAERLSEILADNFCPGPTVPEKLASGGVPLSREQVEAVKMALSHRLSLILGGAGVGKTTLIRALADLQGQNVVLCAPTGKAARNLKDKTGHPAYTVHSALGMLPDSNFLNAVRWSFTKLLVVDEASMMTLEMLAGVLKKAPPTCHIVLVGDPNQLLSVGSGNVLPDLLTLGIPHALLEIGYRQSAKSAALQRNVQCFSRLHNSDELDFGDSFQFIPTATEQAAQGQVGVVDDHQGGDAMVVGAVADEGHGLVLIAWI